jgi:hypothetical protein
MRCLDCHEIPRGSPPEGAALLQVQKIAVLEDAGCVLTQNSSIGPVLPALPIRKSLAIYILSRTSLHRMEELIGSIPTRSTKHFKHLAALPFRDSFASLVADSKTTPRALGIPPKTQSAQMLTFANLSTLVSCLPETALRIRLV